MAISSLFIASAVVIVIIVVVIIVIVVLLRGLLPRRGLAGQGHATSPAVPSISRRPSRLHACPSSAEILRPSHHKVGDLTFDCGKTKR
jgi:hypothetical protein